MLAASAKLKNVNTEYQRGSSGKQIGAAIVVVVVMTCAAFDAYAC